MSGKRFPPGSQFAQPLRYNERFKWKVSACSLSVFVNIPFEPSPRLHQRDNIEERLSRPVPCSRKGVEPLRAVVCLSRKQRKKRDVITMRRTVAAAVINSRGSAAIHRGRKQYPRSRFLVDAPGPRCCRVARDSDRPSREVDREDGDIFPWQLGCQPIGDVTVVSAIVIRNYRIQFVRQLGTEGGGGGGSQRKRRKRGGKRAIEDRENDEADDVEMDRERARRPGINSRAACTVITLRSTSRIRTRKNEREQYRGIVRLTEGSSVSSHLHLPSAVSFLDRPSFGGCLERFIGSNLSAVENREGDCLSCARHEISSSPVNSVTYVDLAKSPPWKRLIIGWRAPWNGNSSWKRSMAVVGAEGTEGYEGTMEVELSNRGCASSVVGRGAVLLLPSFTTKCPVLVV